MQKLLVAGVAAIVLVLGAAVPVLALNTQAWEERRIATEAFDAAADAALDASADAALAAEELADAREAAELVLTDASAVASAAPGYFNATVLDPLTAAVAALENATAAEAPDGPAMPSTERPQSIEELRTAVEPLTAWADAEAVRAGEVAALAEELATVSAVADEATRTLAETVGAEASAALGAAPLATPESRAAVEAARDAVVAALEKTLGKPIADYTASVSALRVSQQAAADAAAAAAASEDSGDGFDREAFERQVYEWMKEMGGYTDEDCVQNADGGHTCY